MLTTVLPLLFGLSSCSQPDTIDPESAQANSEARVMATGVLHRDDFENNLFAKFWTPELRTPTAGLVSTEYSRSGNKSMRFAWKPSQYDGGNPSKHSELAMAPLEKGENERWYGYSMFFPSATMANDDQTAIVTQWHGFPDPGFEDTVPPLAIELVQGNYLKLFYRASNQPITKLLQVPTSQKIMILGKASFDQWVDFVVHVKWDPTGNTGILEIWQDGVKKVDEKNINIGYPQMRKPYWKIGLYCWTGTSKHQERTLFYDDIRVGGPTATYETVRPGAGNGTGR